MMKLARTAAAAAAAMLLAGAAHAGLIGQEVTGELYVGGSSNLFDPAPVTVGDPSGEFFAADAGVFYTVDFTDDLVTISLAGFGTTVSPWTMRFTTQSLFSGQLVLLSDFDPPLDAAIVGGALEFSWDGGTLPDANGFRATYLVDVGDGTPVPEPGSLALAALAFAGAAFARRRAA